MDWNNSCHCTILTPAGVTSEPFANARYYVDTTCDGRLSKCTENGFVNQDSRDDLFGGGHIVIAPDFPKTVDEKFNHDHGGTPQ